MKMLRRTFILITAAVAMCASDAAHADGTTGILLYPTIAVRRATGVVGGDQIAYQFDFRAGYVTPAGWYFGMINSKTSSSGVNSINEDALGNSVGYFYGPASLIVSYFLRANHTEHGASGEVVRSDGDGWQFDLAYHFPIPQISGLQLGPAITYSTFNYLKEEANGMVTGVKHTESYVYPTIALSYFW